MIMLRNLLTSIVPVAPDLVLQIYWLEMAAIGSFMVVVWCKPWRSPWMNVLDGGFSIIFLEFILEVAMSARVAGTDLVFVGWLCIVSILFAFVLAFASMSLAALKRLGLPRSRFQFFLCCSQAEVGAFARWLQAELASHPGVTGGACLEVDIPEPLDRLLMRIAEQVDRVLVLATQGLFQRPWCIGEIAAAYRNSIPIGVLSMPCFAKLEEQLVNRLVDSALPEPCLAEVGIHISLVREALHELAREPPIELPEHLNPARMRVLMSELVVGSATRAAQTAHVALAQGSTAILADTTTFEANVVAHLLRAILASRIAAAFGEDAEVLPIGEELASSVEKAVVVCTQACFRRGALLHRILEASRRKVRLILAISDADVCVPSRAMLAGIMQNIPSQESCVDELVDVTLELFSTIAVNVNAKRATLAELDIVKGLIVSRLSAMGTF